MLLFSGVGSSQTIDGGPGWLKIVGSNENRTRYIDTVIKMSLILTIYLITFVVFPYII
jgi:hypothetical protein